MNCGKLQFGSLVVDGISYYHDLNHRPRQASQAEEETVEEIPRTFRTYSTSLEEKIAWKCKSLVVGTGRYRSLPVMDEVKAEARRRKIRLLIVLTDEALEILIREPEQTNAILHVTC